MSGGLGYLGAQDFAGTDDLTVEVYYDEDADVATATAEVTQQATITVNEVNDPPTVSGPVTLSAIDEDTSVKVYASDLLANATDDQTVTIDGTPTLAVPAQGTLSAVGTDENGDYWTFTPAQDFNGTVDLSFDVTDGTTSVSTSASVTVNQVDDLPVITSPDASGDEDQWFGIPGVRITDVDTTDAVKVTLSVDQGKLGIEGVMEGPTLTLTGTLADINKQLMGTASHYEPEGGPVTLTAGELAALTPVAGAQVPFVEPYSTIYAHTVSGVTTHYITEFNGTNNDYVEVVQTTPSDGSPAFWTIVGGTPVTYDAAYDSNYMDIYNTSTPTSNQSLVRYGEVKTDGTSYYGENPSTGYYSAVEPEGLPVFEQTVGEVTTRYEYDGVLGTLTPLVDGYERDHGATIPSDLHSTDPVADSWTEEASGVTFSGGGAYTIYAQPGTGDLYAFSVYTTVDDWTDPENPVTVTSYNIHSKVHLEEQPDTYNQL